MIHKILLIDGRLNVDLPSGSYPTTLVMTYSTGGDPVFPKRWGGDALAGLYDLAQTDDRIKSGDEFSYRGRIVARVEGFHVVEV